MDAAETSKHSKRYRAYSLVLISFTVVSLYMVYLQTNSQYQQKLYLSLLEEEIPVAVLENSITPKINNADSTLTSVQYSNSSSFLVNGLKCKIPNLAAINSDSKSFYRKNSYTSCSTRPLLTYVTVEDNVAFLHINESAEKSYSKNGTSCCYSNIVRVDRNDDTWKIDTCQNFKGKTILSKDIVLVKCTNPENGPELYKNVHVAVRLNDNIKKKLKTANEKVPSLLLVGIDSVSRLNFIREMPLTHDYLRTHDWIEMQGYNKIGDNTFPNLIGVISGLNESRAYSKCKPKTKYFDNCTYAWNYFREFGYVTAYAEDEAKINTFNFHKKGFLHPPTDYYFRPYFSAAESKLNVKIVDDMKYCTGPETSGERVLRLALQFVRLLRNSLYFGFFWMNSFSHNKLNSLSRMDEKVHDFVKELERTGAYNNTIVVLFSDHGLRFGDFRYTTTGWLEERLPMLFFWVPKSFRQAYPAKYKNLQLNQGRLVTPYDLYMTLQDLLKTANDNYSVTPSDGCPKCKSLFEEVELDRSCEDAGVEQHWCTCNGYTAFPKRHETTKSAASFILNSINGITNAQKKHCARYSIRKIMSSSMSVDYDNWYKNDTYLIVILETRPEAVFEATVSVQRNGTGLAFKLEGAISRLDSYDAHSRCMGDVFLRKYCYCIR